MAWSAAWVTAPPWTDPSPHMGLGIRQSCPVRAIPETCQDLTRVRVEDVPEGIYHRQGTNRDPAW
jgi:hypothetical protein